MFVRSRPRTKLLAIVADYDHRPRMLGIDLTQVVNGLLGLTERDQVPQPFAAGKHAQHAPFVFREVVSVQLVVP